MAETSEAVAGLSSGLRAIQARTFLTSEKYQEQQWRAVRDGAHPKILLFEVKLVRRMRKLGVPMFAHTIVRSNEEQTAAFVRGVSKARAGESAHNYGLAVDVIHGIHGWEIANESWRMIGHIGKEVAAQNGIRIVWGGDWNFYDPAHWELENWKELKEWRK